MSKSWLEIAQAAALSGAIALGFSAPAAAGHQPSVDIQVQGSGFYTRFATGPVWGYYPPPPVYYAPPPVYYAPPPVYAPYYRPYPVYRPYYPAPRGYWNGGGHYKGKHYKHDRRHDGGHDSDGGRHGGRGDGRGGRGYDR